MEINNFSTLCNTTGCGNPTLPTETECGSGDMFVPVEKKKKMQSLKKYLKKHRVG